MLPKIKEEAHQKMTIHESSKSMKPVFSGHNGEKPMLKKKGVSFTKADRNMNPVAGRNSPGPCNY